MIFDYILNNNKELVRINYVDALIFSRLSYIHIEDLRNKLPFTINDLNNYINLIKVSSMDKKLLNLLAKSNRFKKIIIKRCESIIDEKKVEQFCAVTFSLPNKNIFIAYRGTDKSIVGLKEDINMSYMIVPSQVDAVNYLNKENGYNSIYLGGHSKGGNLSMYALIKTNLLNRLRIKKVFNFDGPGFLSLDTDFLKVRNKIESFYPNCSIVGRLMYNNSKKIVFKTSKKGLEGHNIYNWIIKDNEFIKTDFLKISNEFMESTNNLLNKINIKRREYIINSILSIMNKEKIDLIKKEGIGKIKSIILDIPDITKEEKIVLIDYLKLIIKICFLSDKE